MEPRQLAATRWFALRPENGDGKDAVASLAQKPEPRRPETYDNVER